MGLAPLERSRFVDPPSLGVGVQNIPDAVRFCFGIWACKRGPISNASPEPRARPAFVVNK